MAEIFPDGELILCKGVPLDRAYTRTLYFNNLTEQRNLFYSYRAHTLVAQSYQRQTEGKLSVRLHSDIARECNYMMFRNTHYSTKTFYAFIDSVEYVNDNTCYVDFSIDLMQTWYFNYDMGECFVEREHANTDVAGDNLIAENFELGELVCHSKTDVTFPYMLGAIMTTKKLPDTVTWTDGKYYNLDETYAPVSSAGEASGVSNGLYIYAGFPISTRDVDAHFQSNKSNYEMQDFNLYLSTGVPFNLVYVTTGFVVEQIAEGYMSGIDESAIVAVYQYPANLNLKTNINKATALDYRKMVSAGDIQSLTRPTSFASANAPTTYYTPKNKKMLTFPYLQMVVSNNNGQTATFKYEDFSTPTTPYFEWIGNYTPSPTMMTYPINYKNEVRDLNSALVLSNFPVPAYKGDAYAQWLNQNRASITSSLMTGAISAGTSIGLGAFGAATANPALIYGGIVSLVSTVAGTMAKQQDIKNTPPQAYAQNVCDSLNAGVNRTGYKFMHMCIKPEIAKSIDSFFTMFGYATNQVKIPNVRNSTAKRRTQFNYIKTRGAIIKPKTDVGMMSDDIDAISRIYDNGITFWTNATNIGNYSIANPITT